MTPTVALPLLLAFWIGPVVIWALGRLMHPVSMELAQRMARAERRLRWLALLLSLLFVAVTVHFAVGGLPVSIWWLHLVGWNAGVAGYVDIVVLRKILARAPTREQDEPVTTPITPPAAWTAKFWPFFVFVFAAAVTLVFSVSNWQHLTAQRKALVV